MLAKTLEIVGSIAVFIYGMRVMSDGLQRIAGGRLQAVLNYMTMNRVASVLTGFLVTGVIQSSSATTIMVVTFANAGLLTLAQSIGVIMGANIGTTVTGWIVSIIGFKFTISAIAFPIIACGFPLMFFKDKSRKDLSEVLIGFGLLFLGLKFLKDAVPNIRDNPEALEFLSTYTNAHWILHFALFVAVGTILTILMQSSSATMAVTITLAFNGAIDFPSAAAMVLGENIGTTIKANLVSLGAHVNARRAARVHTIFNLAGVVWMFVLFSPLLRPHLFALIEALVPGQLLTGDPGMPYISKNIPMHLSMFHTLFNLTNTLIFIWFVPRLADVVTKLVPSREGDAGGAYTLQFISSPGQDTTAINLVSARKETAGMAAVAVDMLDILVKLLRGPRKKRGRAIQQLKDKEELTDRMQEELSRFLAQCAEGDLDQKVADEVSAMIRIVTELEHFGDDCYKLVLLADRAHDKKMDFHPDAAQGMGDYLEALREQTTFFAERVGRCLSKDEFDEVAQKLDQMRSSHGKLVKAARRRIQAGGNVRAELLFVDFLRHFEHLSEGLLSMCRDMQCLHSGD